MNHITDSEDFDNRLQLARRIAVDAGHMITDLFHRTIRAQEKEPDDYVTELDRAIETMALERVARDFPQDGFYGEEGASVKSSSGYEWVVDPIDGTNNFVRGLPLCGFQLAILYEGEPVLGLIHRPLTQEFYTAIKDGGAHYENEMIHEKCILNVSNRPLKHAIGIYDAKVGHVDNPSTAIMSQLARHTALSRVFGVAVFDLPAIAEGAAEFLITGMAKKYDIAAGMLLIEEAGGHVYSVKGTAIDLDDELIVFSNQMVKSELLEAIRPA